MRTGGREYFRRMPAISNRLPLTAPSSNPLPTSGSIRMSTIVTPINRLGMSIPRFSKGIWRW